MINLTVSNLVWPDIRRTFATIINCSEDVLDYIAVQPILEHCLLGYSNKAIATIYNISEEDVILDIKQFLGFDGFSRDLSYKPLVLYSNSCKEDFMSFFWMRSDLSDSQIERLYSYCEIYSNILKEINLFYGGNSPS